MPLPRRCGSGGGPVPDAQIFVQPVPVGRPQSREAAVVTEQACLGGHADDLNIRRELIRPEPDQHLHDGADRQLLVQEHAQATRGEGTGEPTSRAPGWRGRLLEWTVEHGDLDADPLVQSLGGARTAGAGPPVEEVPVYPPTDPLAALLDAWRRLRVRVLPPVQAGSPLRARIGGRLGFGC